MKVMVKVLLALAALIVSLPCYSQITCPSNQQELIFLTTLDSNRNRNQNACYDRNTGLLTLTLDTATTGKWNSIRIVDGTKFTTIQAAINDACQSSPVATVVVPAATYSSNSVLILCSNLTIQFSPGVTITTTLSSGALFGLSNMSYVKLLGYPTISKSGTAGGTAVQCNYCQNSRVEVTVSGNFSIALDVDSNSSGSSIYNDFALGSATGLAASGICVNITISGGKVVNANRFYNPVCGPNTAGGVTAWNDGGSHENSVFGGDLSTSDTTAGKGVVTTSGTRNLNFYGTTIENNNQGWSINASSEGVRCYGCTIDSNTTNIVSTGNRSWLQGTVGGIVPTLSLDQNGNIQINGIGIGGASANVNGINLPTGGTLQASGTNILTFNSTGPAVMSSTFASLPASSNGTLIYCSDCTITSPCAGAGTGALAKRLNAAWVCN